jgi:serine/threonine-protein kinase
LTVPCQPPFTQPGNRTGTANYMSPEVVRRKPTSQRLDIFSFGVTVYEMCAFELPWPRGAGQAAMAHASQDPTDLKKYCPKIDPRLDRAVMACLESSPDKRPGSMDEFLRMIRDVNSEFVS